MVTCADPLPNSAVADHSWLAGLHAFVMLYHFETVSKHMKTLPNKYVMSLCSASMICLALECNTASMNEPLRLHFFGPHCHISKAFLGDLMYLVLT